MRQYLTKLWEKHSEKISAGAFALASQQGDLFLTKFLPIPGDLVWRGVFATALCGFVSVVAAGLVVRWLKHRAQHDAFRWLCVGWMTATLFITACFYRCFFWVEDAWKLTDDSAHEKQLYFFWEPLIYGLTFAAFGAFLVFGFAVVKDWWEEQEVAPPTGTATPATPPEAGNRPGSSNSSEIPPGIP